MPEEELRHEIAAGVAFWGYEDAGQLVGVMGIQDVKRIYNTPELAPGKNLVFAACGVTDGNLLQGVRFTGDGVHCRPGAGARRQQQASDGRSHVRTSPRDGNTASPEAKAHAEAGRATRHHLPGPDGGWRCGNRGGLPRPGPVCATQWRF